MSPVSPGSLRWGVKSSFLRYVRVIAHGTYTVTQGARADTEDVFEFPIAGAEERGGHWVLSFSGSVRFEAHHGFLDVTLAELTLAVGPERGSLSIASPENQDRVVIATVSGAGPAVDEDWLRWPALEAELTEAGAEVFGGVYPAGTELAPLEVVLS